MESSEIGARSTDASSRARELDATMPPAKTSVVAAAATAAAAILIVARLRRRRRAPPSGLSSRPAKPDDYATLCALDAVPPTHGGHSLFDVRLTRASREGVQKVLVLCEGGGEALCGSRLATPASGRPEVSRARPRS